jgi:hypothetical protein
MEGRLPVVHGAPPLYDYIQIFYIYKYFYIQFLYTIFLYNFYIQFFLSILINNHSTEIKKKQNTILLHLIKLSHYLFINLQYTNFS